MTVRTYSRQKAALTRVVNRLSPEYQLLIHTRGGSNPALTEQRVRKLADAVRIECVRAVREWNSREGQFTYGWPADWHRWNIALGVAAVAYRRAGGRVPFPDHLADIAA